MPFIATVAAAAFEGEGFGDDGHGEDAQFPSPASWADTGAAPVPCHRPCRR